MNNVYKKSRQLSFNELTKWLLAKKNITSYQILRKRQTDPNYKVLISSGKVTSKQVTRIDKHHVIITNIDNHQKLQGIGLLLSFKLESDKYKRMAYKDPLTGIPNRRWGDYVINEIPSNTKFTVVGIDLDGFKKINDKLGHEAGDTTLKIFATLLQKLSQDLQGDVCRTGGDEFLGIFTKVNHDILIDYLNKLSMIFIKTIKEKFGRKINIGFSFGVVTAPKTSETSKVLNLVDKTMYKQKLCNHINNALPTFSKMWKKFIPEPVRIIQ